MLIKESFSAFVHINLKFTPSYLTLEIRDWIRVWGPVRKIELSIEFWLKRAD